MDIKAIGSKLMTKPWLVAGVVILVLFLSRGKSASGGINYDAMLQSQQIVTAGNLQAGQTYAQMYAVDAGRNAAFIQAQKEIILGKQALAGLDKTLATQYAAKALEVNQAAQDSANAFAMGLTSNALSHAERVGDLQIQALRLVNEGNAAGNAYSLGVKSLDNDKLALNNALVSLGNDYGVAMAGINATTDIQKLGINSEYDWLKYSLPAQERMNHDAEETTRNLAWRAKQIAKAAGSTSLFNNLISGGFGLANNALSIFGNK